MPVRKRSVSLEPHAAHYLDQRAKTLKRSVSAVLSEIVAEAAQMEARDRVFKEFGDGVELSERSIDRWLKKLGAA
jgi:hypothetical protein